MATTDHRFDAARTKELLGFLGFTDEDAQLLRSLLPWAEREVPKFVRVFYDRSFKMPAMAAVVRQQGSSRERLETA
jgi:hypothetical protein